MQGGGALAGEGAQLAAMGALALPVPIDPILAPQAPPQAALQAPVQAVQLHVDPAPVAAQAAGIQPVGGVPLVAQAGVAQPPGGVQPVGILNPAGGEPGAAAAEAAVAEHWGPPGEGAQLGEAAGAAEEAQAAGMMQPQEQAPPVAAAVHVLPGEGVQVQAPGEVPAVGFQPEAGLPALLGVAVAAAAEVPPAGQANGLVERAEGGQLEEGPVPAEGAGAGPGGITLVENGDQLVGEDAGVSPNSREEPQGSRVLSGRVLQVDGSSPAEAAPPRRGRGNRLRRNVGQVLSMAAAGLVAAAAIHVSVAGCRFPYPEISLGP